MSKYRKNFVILGKTGAGKSELINHILSREVAQTRAGLSCTPEGQWQEESYPSPFEPDTTLTFFDSWGLEPDKAAHWKKLVNEKLTSDWDEKMICGVIYCFTYSKDRAEDFEFDMLRHVLQTGYKVLIVLTNLDEADAKKRETYATRICEELGKFKGQYAVAEVTNIDDKKKDGRPIRKTGREEVLKKLSLFATDNLYTLYCNGLYRIYNEIEEILDEEIKAAASEAAFMALDPWKVHMDPTLTWWTAPSAVEEGALQARLDMYKNAFCGELQKFGKVYEAVYQVEFKTPPSTFWDSLKALFGFYRTRNQTLLEAYAESLRELKERLLRACAGLRKQRHEVYFGNKPHAGNVRQKVANVLKQLQKKKGENA